MSKELERRQLRSRSRFAQWRRRHASDRRLCVEIQQAVPQSGRLGGADRTRVAEQVHGRWLARRDGPLQPRTSAGSIAGESLRLAIDGTGPTTRLTCWTTLLLQRVRALVARGDVSRSFFAAYMHESDWSSLLTASRCALCSECRLLTWLQLTILPITTPRQVCGRWLRRGRFDVAEVEQLARENRLTELIASCCRGV